VTINVGQKEEFEVDEVVVVTRQRAVSSRRGESALAERTDDPLRIYLRDMTWVELLSREGEIAIAKRIEAGRERRASWAISNYRV
jgi:RNA polymerase primary sigma factor